MRILCRPFTIYLKVFAVIPSQTVIVWRYDASHQKLRALRTEPLCNHVVSTTTDSK